MTKLCLCETEFFEYIYFFFISKHIKLSINGHSIEARVYAEDPMNGFLPGAGTLHYLNQPASEESVRVETGVREGDDVSQYYDPMIAKV